MPSKCFLNVGVDCSIKMLHYEKAIIVFDWRNTDVVL